MLLNSIYGTYGLANNGGCGCNTCGCGNTMYANNGGNGCGCGCGNQGCGCGNGCGCGCGGNYGSNLGSAAYCFIGEWVNIVVTLTILQSILGLVCNWNCGNGSC